MNSYTAKFRDKRTGNVFNVYFSAKCDECAMKKAKGMKAASRAVLLSVNRVNNEDDNA